MKCNDCGMEGNMMFTKKRFGKEHCPICDSINVDRDFVRF